MSWHRRLDDLIQTMDKDGNLTRFTYDLNSNLIDEYILRKKYNDTVPNGAGIDISQPLANELGITGTTTGCWQGL